MVEFDKLLEDLNKLSFKQWKQLALLMIPAVLVASQMGAMVYLGANVEHRCAFPMEEDLTQKCNETWTEEQSAKYSPASSEDDQSCKRYEIPTNSMTSECDFWWPQSNKSNTSMAKNTSWETVSCHEWVYNSSSTFESTILSEFDLVCQQTYLRHFAQAIFMLGVTLGCVFWGQVADSYGRITSIIGSAVIGAAFGITVVFVKSYTLFVVLRSASGFCLFPAFTSSYVLATEIVAPALRVRVGQTSQSFFALGFCLLAMYGFFIRNWRTLQLMISVPMLGMLPFYWILFESPRWLISKRRFRDAHKIVEGIIKSAGVDQKPEEAKLLQRIASDEIELKKDEDDKDSADEGEKRSYGPLDLVRTPNLRKKSFNLFYCWLVCSVVYYGLTLNAADLGGDPFINLFLSGFVEIPASCLAIIIIEKWGRRPSLSFSLITSGLACMAMLFVPKDLFWLNICLSMLGKFSIAAAFGVVYIFAAELYPTPIRNVGIGTCSSFARIGGIMSPLIAMLNIVAEPLPYVVFGMMAVFGGILALFLPEVLGIRLPETIKEGEEFGLGQQGPLDRLWIKIGCGKICGGKSDAKTRQTEYKAVEVDQKPRHGVMV